MILIHQSTDFKGKCDLAFPCSGRYLLQEKPLSVNTKDTANVLDSKLL